MTDNQRFWAFVTLVALLWGAALAVAWDAYAGVPDGPPAYRPAELVGEEQP